MAGTDLFLASASPRRAKLLRQIDSRFETLSVEVDETPEPGEAAVDFVTRLALAKARAGLAVRPAGRSQPVLGSDTAVVVEGEIFGKPRDRQHALAMLARLSGRCHEVMTAVALVDDTREAVSVNVSRVCMREIRPAEAEAYWASGEPQGKAGGYAVQGLGAVFIHELHGSYSGVMGLPLYETAQLLAEFGTPVLRQEQAR